MYNFITNRIFIKGLAALSFNILVKMGSLFKVSYIIGSYSAFFSVSSMIVPLSGAFGGLSGALSVAGVGLLLQYLMHGITFKILAYHIPGMFASLYWTTQHGWFRLGIPLLCMMLFIAHPVGGAAWVYTLYWLVPVALYFFKHKNSLCIQALGSTFMAHAVGSTIWLYADPMTPEIWLNLIPIVFVERLVLAIGMVCCYRVMHAALNMVHTPDAVQRISIS